MPYDASTFQHDQALIRDNVKRFVRTNSPLPPQTPIPHSHNPL
jgi:hypothetical protein